MTYTQTQWIMMFYFYCVAGWVWETLYVSIRKKQWINRGFLYGPWLPIYGTGAILILFTTLPFAESSFLIFLIGMISATALEYVTGAVMEHIFHMRYWDYSEEPLNLNGHICLKVSVAWGFFSLFLVRVLHPPVDHGVRLVSGWLQDVLSILLTILFSVDVTKSVQDALDLKALLIKMTDSNDFLNRLDSKFDSLVEKLEGNSANFRERLSEIDNARTQWLEERQNRKRKKEVSSKVFLLSKLEEHRNRKSKLLAFATEKASAALMEAEEQLCIAETRQDYERLQKLIDALTDFLAAVRCAEIDLASRKNRDFQRAVSILERNPSAHSGKYHQAMAELKSLKRTREDRSNNQQD